MIRTTVAIRSVNPATPPCPADGFVPYEGSPLAVTIRHTFQVELKEWTSHPRQYVITHVPTGRSLRGADWNWPTRKEAMTVLERCEPTFAAWPLALGGTDDRATIACAMKFRAAIEGQSNA